MAGAQCDLPVWEVLLRPALGSVWGDGKGHTQLSRR